MPGLLRHFSLASSGVAAAAVIALALLVRAGADEGSVRLLMVAGSILSILFLALFLLIGRADRELRRQLDDSVRLTQALAAAPVGMLLVDAGPGNPIVYANEAFARSTGLDTAALVGRGIEAIYGSAARGLLGDEAARVEIAIRRADGSPLWIELDVNPVGGDDGAVTGWVLAQADIARRHVAEAAVAENERRLRLVTDAIPALIGQLDRDLRFRFANHRFEEWFGRPTWWFIGRHVREVAGEHAYFRARRAFCEAVRGATSRHDNQITADGKVRDVHVQIVPQRTSAGEVSGFFVVVNDVGDSRKAEVELRRARDEMQAAVEMRTRELRREIVERRQMEVALRESERRFRDVAEAASDWFWEMGPDLRFTYFSGRLSDFTGVTADDVIGKTRREMASEEDLEELEPHFRDLEERRPFRDLRYRMRRPDGSHRHIKVSGKPVFDDDGRFLGFRGTGCDVSEQVEMEARTAALQRQLAMAVEGMSDGFALWDASDRLVICNDALRLFFPVLADRLQPGLSFADFGDLVVDTGMGDEPPRHAPGDVLEWQRADGRWLMIVERRMPEGQIVATFTDISERKAREAALKHSEERFRLLVQTAGSAIMVLSRDLRLLEFNRAAERIYGVARDDVVGRSYFELCPTDAVRASVVAVTDRVLAGEAMTELETRIHSAEGCHYDVIWNAHRLVDAQGAVFGVIAVGQDITERKSAERALRESQSALRALHEITASQELDFSDKLRALLRFGCSRFGLPLGIVARLGDEPKIIERVEAAEQPEVSIHALAGCRLLQSAEQVGHVRQHGAVRLVDGLEDGLPWLEAVLAAPIGIGGETWGSLCFLSDHPRQPFSETDFEVVKLMAQWLGGEIARRKAANELRAAMEQAELANRTKSEFLANMSHELRTPLNAVIGFSEVMMAEVFGSVGTPHYAGYVRNINESGRHLLEVINDILDVSKIEAGRLELIEEEVPVAALVQSAVRLIRERAVEAGLTLEAKVAEDLPKLRADQRRLKQVLLNLLSNAIKFTPAGGRVVLSAERRDDGGLVLAVRDTGIGMAPDDIPKAMAPFGQIDSRLARRHEGTGLGLPLTRSLVELHGGRLELSSAPGVGTTVRAIFPPGRLGAARRTVPVAG